MILSGKEIASRIGDEIIIDPYDENKINPNSYNLALHDELIVYENFPLDMKKENQIKKLLIPKDGIILEPNCLYLGRTIEYTETKNLVPMLEGRSSIGRLGLMYMLLPDLGMLALKVSGHWKYSAFNQ